MERDDYGKLIKAEGLAEAKKMVEAATKELSQLDYPYDDLERDREGRWDGSARHHEIYDIRINRAGRVGAVLLCVRCTKGSRWGVATVSKNYYIISRKGRKYSIETAKKAIAAKAAKSTYCLGDAIDILQSAGKLSIPVKPRVVYKKVSVVDGRYLSIYDGTTEYKLGVEMQQAAKPGHEGGIYCYPEYGQALWWEIPDAWPGAKRPTAILRCQAAGRTIAYGNGKRAVSKLTPLAVVDGWIEIINKTPPRL